MRQFRGIDGLGHRDVVSYIESTTRLSGRSLVDLEIPDAIDMGELSRAPAKVDPRVALFRPEFPPGDPRNVKPSKVEEKKAA